MSRHTPNPHEMDRLLDLLADRAVGELDPRDAAELDRLLEANPGLPADAMDAAAAAASLAMPVADDDPMPESLKRRLIADAGAFAERGSAPAGRVGPAPRAGAAWFPWLLAAASIALAAVAWVSRPAAQSPTPNPTIAQQLDEFTTVAPPADLVRVAWAGQPDPLVTEQLAGEVYWSQSRQQGYMVFSGLRANDPTVEQYQLWIFDGSREHPVDGGVFDIGADGRAIVPIDAKLTVRQPTLFAVTVEKPGGVVVSSKERIAVVAPLAEG